MPARPPYERGLINHEWRLGLLEDAVKRLRQQGINTGGSASGGGGGFYVGVATSAISARSGAALGSGTYEIYSTASGTLTASGVTGTAYNAGAAIASGKHIALQKDSSDGTMMAAPLEC